ncbi:MAG: ribosome recycling factor [Mangrovibacterium sp.]
MEEVDFILDVCREKMEGALSHLETELVHIRAGKASPHMISGVVVDYYGSMTPITQVANVTAPDARTIAIQPWEKQLIPEIEKAIINSNLGFNPENNGEIVRITVPVLTEERRKGLAKQASAEAENAKVGIRNARKEANDGFKKLLKEGLSEDNQKDAEATVQTMTNNYSKKVEEMLAQKNDDIFKI